MKRFIAALLAIFMVFSLTVSAFAEETATSDKLNYLLLGDSIAVGSGLLNPDDACYGRMVANTNGYNYKNDAVNGLMSGGLKNMVKTNAEVIEDIKNADIISISIGGNDFLQSDWFIPVILSALVGYMGIEEEKIIKNFYPNFCEVIDTIKEINPDATILVQTLYNPRYVFLRATFARGVSILNNCYYQYLEENPGAYIIVDVASALSNKVGFIAVDTVHPNSYGNKLIAKEILATLKELGLGENTEPVVNAQPVDEIAAPVYFPIQWLSQLFSTVTA